LKELSRLAVRRLVPGENLVRYVPELPLPESLKLYMLFAAEKPMGGAGESLSECNSSDEGDWVDDEDDEDVLPPLHCTLGESDSDSDSSYDG
jgi:hypothetical protein